MAVSALLSRALFDYFQNYLTYFQLSYQYLVDFQDISLYLEVSEYRISY